MKIRKTLIVLCLLGACSRAPVIVAVQRPPPPRVAPACTKADASTVTLTTANGKVVCSAKCPASFPRAEAVMQTFTAGGEIQRMVECWCCQEK